MRLRFLPLLLAAAMAPCSAQTTPSTCSATTLASTYSMVLTGRALNTSGVFTATYDAVGSVTFSQSGAVVFSLVSNTNVNQAMSQTLAGTYTLGPNCLGTVNIATGDSASFTLLAFNSGRNFTIAGKDATYALSGDGGSYPPLCLNSTVSGTYSFSGTGFSFAAGKLAAADSVAGELQFDGRGVVSISYTDAETGVAGEDGSAGGYSVTQSCNITGSLKDDVGDQYSFNGAITSADASEFVFTFVRSVDDGAYGEEFSAVAHSTFTNPGLAVTNSASGVSGGTPPGSLFSVYGVSLAPTPVSATQVPLPQSLVTVGVTVNGEAVPLFYVSPGQINAQMPWDTQPGVANVAITGAYGNSNTVAVTVPATAVPGVFQQYPGSQAVAVEYPEQTLNTPSAPAAVGDTVVVYFTGGGPVQTSVPLVSGNYSPLGQSPVTETTGTLVTVGGVQAVVNYIGLTGDLVGVYQVNFVVPQVAAGDQDLVVTIGGTASAVTTLSVSN